MKAILTKIMKYFIKHVQSKVSSDFILTEYLSYTMFFLMGTISQLLDNFLFNIFHFYYLYVVAILNKTGVSA